MREIKFRAMTKPPEDFGHFKFKSEMVFGTGILYDPCNTWIIRNDKTRAIAYGKTQHIIKPETLGQFTGLHDKNGKEIYEGDIYKSSWDTNSIVKWTKKDTREVSGQGGSERVVTAGYVLGFLPDEIEIIGNIHENPELLK